MSVVIKDLVKQYGNQRALDTISFRVKPGEIVGFLGPNGAGKSTTMKIATGYLPPTTGNVLVNNADVSEKPLEVRRQVGYLPEHNPLYLDMYVLEYLNFIAGLHKTNKKDRGKRIEEMIELTGLQKERKKKIGSLSKGYRQRVGLAQALVHDPSVLILDEPTTGLDPNQIVEIRSVIKEVSQQKTVILSTHIMQEVQALCNRVIIINAGKIVANQPTETLRTAKQSQTVVKVEFSQKIAPEIFLSLPEVERVEHIEENKYNMFASENSDPRVSIFNLAAQRQLPIIAMQLETLSLEKVFQNLTK